MTGATDTCLVCLSSETLRSQAFSSRGGLRHGATKSPLKSGYKGVLQVQSSFDRSAARWPRVRGWWFGRCPRHSDRAVSPRSQATSGARFGAKGRRARFAAPVSIGLACLLLAAACGSSAKSGAAKAPATKANAGSASTGATLSGAPIVIGFFGGASNVGSPYLDPAVKAAVEYENGIGGIHGRPLKLVICDDQGTPESATSCANEFVSQHVVAVGARLTTAEPQLLTPLQAAGIPFIPAQPTSVAYGSPDAVALMPSAITGLVSAGVYGHEHGLDSSAVLLTNTPASGEAEALAKPYYTKEGVSVSFSLYNIGTPDLTPAVTAATGNNPKTLTVTGTDTTCAEALRAASAIGYKGTIFLAGCGGPKLVQAVGNLIDGTINLTEDMYGMSASDRNTYIAAIHKYAPGLDPNADFAALGFMVVSTVASVLRDMPASSGYSGRAILATFKGLKDFTYPFDLAGPLTCDGTVMPQPQFKSVCTARQQYSTYKNQKEVFLGFLDFSNLFK